MLSQLHLTTNYVQERNKFLIGVEDLKREPYVDTGGIPHIGIGFNLRVTKNLDLVFQELGFDLSGQQLTGDALAAEQQYIQAIRNVINNVKYAPQDNTSLQNNLTQVMYARANDTRYSSSFSRRGGFEFYNDNEVMDVYNSIIDDYETIVDNKLGYHMADSKERIALVSMAYQSGGSSIKRKLVDAITNDNRAEAWFEIRYDSNSSNARWLADRRYKESNMFNLYDSAFDETGAKEVMRMYIIHKTDIEEYQRNYPPPSPIKTQIFAARNWLIAVYGEGKNIDNTIVGAGLPTYSYKDGGSSDIMHGTGVNDLIFGEAGNDIIFGDLFDYGDDVLYGGEGDDWLYGEKGDDFLDGGAGNNILNGGYGNDIYKINSNDGGTNTIEDYDGSGAVMLDGLKLTGGAKDTSGTGGIGGPGRYYDGNGNVYEWDGRNYSDLIINGTIRVENFYDGKIGIHLTGDDTNDKPPIPPTPPEPPNDNRPPAPLPPNNDGGGSGSRGGVTDTDGSYNGSRGSYNGGKNIPVPTPTSPIILDLDGDGVETTGVKDGSYFDHDGNGFAEQTGWAKSDDGMLVLDRNGDGAINDGKELFGNETLLSDGTKAANGFQALSELDSNADGKIDANDAAWSQLKIWKDTDGDGISAGDELLAVSL